MKQKLLLSVFLVLNMSAFTQTIVKGTLKDKKDGTTMIGVSVVANNNLKYAVTTNENGYYELTLPQSKGSIKFSFVGKKTQIIPYQGNQTIDLSMEDDAHNLEQVVVIGYGTARKTDVTTAATNVSGIQRIASRPVSTVNDFLQGSVPGVTVMQQGGDPSGTSKIVFRGLSSLSNENPLMVVDGVPYYGPAINPNDIESISLLKDAASAAIYGAQAASGVIVITTKRGMLGKPVVTVDGYFGLQQATHLPTPLNAKQQADVYNLAADNAGEGRISSHDATKNPWGQVTRTNWIKAIFRPAKIYNFNLGVSGANDNVNYMTSFNYQKRDGILVGTFNEKYAARVKSDYKITNSFTVGENISFNRSEAIGTNSSSPYSGTIINAIYFPSAAPIYDDNGKFHGTAPQNLSQFAGPYGDVYNPVALLLRPTISNPITYFDATGFGKYQIMPELFLKTTYTYITQNLKSKEFTPRIPELGRTNNENFLRQKYENMNKWVWENQLAYQKSFNNIHNVDATLIYSAQKTNFESLYVRGKGFSSEEPYNQYMSNASEMEKAPESYVYEDALTSLIIRGMYNYNSRYYLSASIRRDKTSRLAKNNKAGVFPSVSVAWNIANEDFFKIGFINAMKIRSSWGQIGNINPVDYYSFDIPLRNDGYSILGSEKLDTKGAFMSRQANPNLKWEISQSFDIGLDASLWNHRIDITIDYFNKKTKGMIIPGLTDPQQGIKPVDVNGGQVTNKGLELSLGFNDRIGDWDYNVKGNISFVKNNLDNLDGYSKAALDYINHPNHVRGVLYPYRSTVGKPLYSTFLIPYLGIFQNQAEIDAYKNKDGKLIQPNAKPGDFKFQDVNGDGAITDNDKVFMKAYHPDFTYSLSGNVKYKNFDFSIIFQGVSGGKIFNGYKYTTYNAALNGYNLDSRVLSAWSPENPSATIPRLSVKDNNNNFGTASSWYLEDASYLRLKNVTLGYTFLKDNARVYIGGENLFTITKYSGMDPEVGGIGLDMAQYPISRVYTIGFSYKF